MLKVYNKITRMCSGIESIYSKSGCFCQWSRLWGSSLWREQRLRAPAIWRRGEPRWGQQLRAQLFYLHLHQSEGRKVLWLLLLWILRSRRGMETLSFGCHQTAQLKVFLIRIGRYDQSIKGIYHNMIDSKNVFLLNYQEAIAVVE